MAKKEIEKALKKATNSNKEVKRDASKLPKQANKPPKKDSTKKTPQPRQTTVKKNITVVEVSPGVFIEERRLSKK